MLTALAMIALLVVVPEEAPAAAAGPPYLVKDIHPAGAATPLSFIAYNRKLFFSADDGTNGRELWVSDGTAAGTVLFKDINPGTASSSPRAFVIYGGYLYFGASNGTQGFELWRSDGTVAGTQMFVDLEPGAGHGDPLYPIIAGPYLFFTATDSVHGRELWRTDGTVVGTLLVEDIEPGSTGGLNVPYFAAMGGQLYFDAKGTFLGTRTLWRSDGVQCPPDPTPCPGTAPVAPASPLQSLYSLTTVGTTVFFTGSDGAAHGTELWKSDGTAPGTVMVRDINPGSTTTFFGQLRSFAGRLFFVATGDGLGSELWSSDGTEGGTAVFKDIVVGSGSSNPQSLIDVNGVLYLSAGGQLWKSDGTDPGTVAVANIRPYNPSVFQAIWDAEDGTIVFSADDGTHGAELWISDGTGPGTSMVADIVPGSTGSLTFMDTGATRTAGGRFFFAPQTSIGKELWALPTDRIFDDGFQ